MRKETNEKKKVSSKVKTDTVAQGKKNAQNKIITGSFGTIYNQFQDKPKLAIQHLMKVQEGECPKALYRQDIGYIDIVWGENDPKTNKGYGLKHIVEKHGDSIKALGFNIEDFIPIVVQYGNLTPSETNEEYLLESNMFRVVVEKKAFGKQKLWILTAFDLSKPKKPTSKK